MAANRRSDNHPGVSGRAMAAMPGPLARLAREVGESLSLLGALVVAVVRSPIGFWGDTRDETFRNLKKFFIPGSIALLGFNTMVSVFSVAILTFLGAGQRLGYGLPQLHILASVDVAAEHARQAAAGVVGTLTIGCVGSATYSLLPSLSRRLAEELPGVEFAFRGDMLVADQLEALRDGGIDLALLRPPVADATLAVTPLRQERLVVAVPTGHPLAGRKRIRVTDLADTDLIVHSAGRRSAMYDVVRRVHGAVDPRFGTEEHHGVVGVR